MILSVFISIVLCFKCNMLVAGAILLTLRNWPSWSDRSLIMGCAEDELCLVMSKKNIINCVT
jgi:hypothetical protein